jgi:hypothetical protein
MPLSTNPSLDLADQDLKRRVALFLAGRHMLSLRHLEIDARGGTMTLTGRVGSFDEKQLSQQCCRRVAGVIELVDRVEVVETRRCRRSALAISALVTVLGLSFLAGCGKAEGRRLPVFPARGQVQFEGRPTPGAWVFLHPVRADPRTPRARGEVNEDGTFALTTYHADDGAPAGEYTVTVEWRRVVGRGEDVQIGPNLLPPKYANVNTSGLVVCVAKGANQFPPFQLRR